jgi:hypothetical protein
MNERTIGQIDELIDSQCRSCAHWHYATIHCDAFPDGIPIKILINDVSHQQPYPGDHGIRFELREQQCM